MRLRFGPKGERGMIRMKEKKKKKEKLGWELRLEARIWALSPEFGPGD